MKALRINQLCRIYNEGYYTLRCLWRIAVYPLYQYIYFDFFLFIPFLPGNEPSALCVLDDHCTPSHIPSYVSKFMINSVVLDTQTDRQTDLSLGFPGD